MQVSPSLPGGKILRVRGCVLLILHEVVAQSKVCSNKVGDEKACLLNKSVTIKENKHFLWIICLIFFLLWIVFISQ